MRQYALRLFRGLLIRALLRLRALQLVLSKKKPFTISQPSFIVLKYFQYGPDTWLVIIDF